MTRAFPSFRKKVKRPKNFEQMLKIASVLSAGLPHVRVDLYNIDGKIYFGEMTLTSFAGALPMKNRPIGCSMSITFICSSSEVFLGIIQSPLQN